MPDADAGVSVHVEGLRLRLAWDEGTPVRLVSLVTADHPSAIADHPLVEVEAVSGRHARMTTGDVGTVVGQRLRYVDHFLEEDRLRIRQRDAVGGLEVMTTIRFYAAAPAIRMQHELTNGGDAPVTVLASPGLSVRMSGGAEDFTLLQGRSEWLGEGRWTQTPLIELLPDLAFALVGQPDRGGYGVVSTGGWSTGTVLPTGALLRRGGVSVCWQIESSAGWEWTVSRGSHQVVVTAGGPDDRHHQAAVRLHSGESYETPAVGLAFAAGGRDDVVAAMTRLRRGILEPEARDERLPVVYNDYMNTLMGQPTTEALLPLVDEAAAVGAEVFCIDAGWFSDETDYWGEVGEWREAPNRFRAGLDEVIGRIRDRGMRPGLWIEPESVGLDSAVADMLPPQAFFVREGTAVVQQRRKHLDLHHPQAREHLDQAVDHLVGRHGIDYLKLDYNIEPGSGTDAGSVSPGQGLLRHSRALREWLLALQKRHPGLTIENCASGAMRMDYGLLSVTHLQSTSDQQDAVRYAAIAASAPASILPEQSGNWAYPAADMSPGLLHTTLVNGLAGRLYLSGFLGDLLPWQRREVSGAVVLAKELREGLARRVPFWPLGLPAWDDDLLVLGLRDPEGGGSLTVWNRGPARELRLRLAGLRQVFPTGATWVLSEDAGSATIGLPKGPDAAVFRFDPIPSAEGGRR